MSRPECKICGELYIFNEPHDCTQPTQDPESGCDRCHLFHGKILNPCTICDCHTPTTLNEDGVIVPIDPTKPAIFAPTTKPLDEQIADIIVPHNQYIDAVWRGEHEMYAKPHTYEKIANLIAQEVKKARIDELEFFTDKVIGKGLAYAQLPNHWVYVLRDKRIKELENN